MRYEQIKNSTFPFHHPSVKLKKIGIQKTSPTYGDFESQKTFLGGDIKQKETQRGPRRGAPWRAPQPPGDKKYYLKYRYFIYVGGNLNNTQKI